MTSGKAFSYDQHSPSDMGNSQVSASSTPLQLKKKKRQATRAGLVVAFVVFPSSPTFKAPSNTSTPQSGVEGEEIE